MLHRFPGFILVVSCLSPGLSGAQQSTATTATLIVKVQDPSPAPLKGATVTLAGVSPGWRWRHRRGRGGAGAGPDRVNLVGTTDANGQVVFEGLEPCTVSATASAEGFYSNVAQQVELGTVQQTILTIVLQRRAILHETIVVTGTGTEALFQEAPIRTELITPEIVSRQVKTTLAEVFQATISGVRMEMNCQNCGFMQLRMNGLEGPYTQILEDGLPSYSGVTAVYGLEQIPAGFVDQIEVVKGGNSALYGPGAVAGVVNIIRREPRDDRFRVDAIIGWNRGRPEQQIGGSMQLAQMPVGFAGDFFYRGINRVAVDRDLDGFSDLGRRRLESGGFGLFRRFLDGKARLSASGTVADEFRRGGDQLSKPPHETWITEQIASRRYSAAVGWNHALSPSTFYNLRASHAYYGRASYYGTGMDPNAYGNTRNPLWIADAQAAHQAGRHSILGGYQLSWEYVDDRAPAYNRKLGGVFQNHGLYLQDEWRASKRLSLIGGARFDKSNQVDHWIMSPRVGAKFGLTENLVWRATVSTGFRAPAIFDEDLHIAQVGGEGFILQSAPNLKEETSISSSAGVQYMGTVRGRRYQIGFNMFHTALRDAFTLVEEQVPGQAFRRLLRVNGAGANVAGIDSDGNIQLTSHFALRGGFSVQQARWNEPEEQFGARSFFRTPKDYGFLGFDWDLPGEIEVTGTADYTGSMLVPHYAGYINEDRLEQSSRFVVFNGVVSRTFAVAGSSQMRLFLNIQNIGDSYQRDLDRGPDRDSAYVYGPAEMRRVLVGLTFEF